MSSAPAISVVIPTGSVDGDLTTQLRAVLAQEDTAPFEVIVSLNTADPAARRALDACLTELADPRVRSIDSSQVRGAAHARNAGARAALGDLLAFCDADDVVRPGWLANITASLVGPAARFDAVSGLCVDFSDEGEVPKWLPPPPRDALPTFLGVPYLLSGNLAIKRAVFEMVGGFDETLTRCEDIALSWQLLRKDVPIGFEPSAVLDYRIRPSVPKMLRQHYYYGIGMSEVLVRHGRPGEDGAAGAGTLLRPNNSKGGLRSPVAILRKVAIAAGRLVGMFRERRRKQG
jgi:GT2 family glycosyltransferase